MTALIDTHAHLHDRAFDTDRGAVLERARAAGVASIVTVGTDLAASEAALALADQHADVYATVGVHPHDANTWSTTSADRLRSLARHPKVVAIGEIGFDLYRNLSPRANQERAFRAQLALAGSLRLPVVIHARDADDATFRVLREWAPQASCGEPVGVLHCFASDAALAEQYVALGFLISIAGVVTYPRNERAQRVAARAPAESFVLETDCPYLTPQFKRGRRNEPAYLAETARFIAGLRGEDRDQVAARCTANARRLFRLPAAAPVTR